MSKPVEKTLLFITDFLTINATFWLWAKLRAHAGYFAEPLPQQFLINTLIVFLFWFLLFIFYGLYRSWHALSRVDELINVGKTISLGVFLIFLVTIDLQQDLQEQLKLSRTMIVSYWLLMIIFVSSGRLALRTFQRTLLEAGLGMRNTLIIGGGDKAYELFDEIRKFPALGYNLIGFAGPGITTSYKGTPWLGELDEVREVIEREQVEVVLIAIEHDARAYVTIVLALCEGLPVELKIVPDLYDAIVGQVHTHQIYGMPLIEVMPELMPAWERRVKRTLDFGVAALASLFLLPLGIIIACALRLHTRNSVLTSEIKVGKAGRLFRLYQFHLSAATATTESSFLKFVFSMGWDKMPRLLNVLKGDLSLVGPHAENPKEFEKLKLETPFYSWRWRVQPGLTGWAQIKTAKRGTHENSRRDLQYDFFYIENMSLRMDLKILLIALYDAMITRGTEKVSKNFVFSEANSIK